MFEILLSSLLSHQSALDKFKQLEGAGSNFNLRCSPNPGKIYVTIFKQPSLIWLLVFITSITYASCRCGTNFDTVIPTSNVFDSTIIATADMWQGQYEYLTITIKINRKDSLFVKEIIVKPYLPEGDFFPSFDYFSMYSYYDGNKNGESTKEQTSYRYYWKDYSAKTFEKLPSQNRKTNKDNFLISYTLHYNSLKSIDFENFRADVDILLVDSYGKEIRHSTNLEFSGRRECSLSTH